MNGPDLIAAFRKSGSESAFTELVRCYTNLVFSVAKRRLENVALAEEVTQMVFLRLAKAVSQFRSERELVGWLHGTTVHVAIDVWRAEHSRRVREQHALPMNPTSADSPAWSDISPVLDEAINQLNDSDREAILLRYYAEKPMREVGSALGVSEDAAKMRVSRALDRLRGQLGTRGVTCTVAGLAAMLSAHTIEAAPAALVAALAAIKVSSLATAGWVATWLARMRSPVGIGAAALVVLTAVTAFMLYSPQGRGFLNSELAAPDRNEPSRTVAAALSDSGQTNTAAPADIQPDPRKLLIQAARARQRITSGKVQLESSVFQPKSPDGHPNVTNSLRLTMEWDGEKRRAESYGKSYSYATISHEEEKLEREKRMIREQQLDRETAVRMGLLKASDERTVSIYDGAALLSYRETDGRPGSAVIDDPSKGTAGYLFDPRVLGISEYFISATPENCLGYGAAKSIEFAGNELVEGLAALHVHVTQAWDTYSGTIDIWLDASNPVHIVRYDRELSFGQGTKIQSRYDPAHPEDPLPIETISRHFRGGGELRSVTQFRKPQSEYNVTIGPARWTLAGLELPFRADVTDVRVQRRLGYWDGSGLTEDFPSQRKTNAEPATVVDMAKLTRLLEIDPRSPEGLEAAKWILLNTPDGPEVAKAADVLLTEHIWETNLVEVAVELDRFRHQSSTNLLEALLEKNPSPGVKGNACFTLALLAKEQADHGKNQAEAKRAEALFERAGREFGKVKRRRNWTLAELAKPELHELRHASVGQPAPETKGVDLNGREVNLADYRGKVVVLTWWADCTAAWELKQTEKMVAPYAADVAIIGIYNDKDLSKPRSLVETNEIQWPTIQDGSRRLMEAWNVPGWQTVIVVDQQGIIRERGIHWELGKAVAELLGKTPAQ